MYPPFRGHSTRTRSSTPTRGAGILLAAALCLAACGGDTTQRPDGGPIDAAIDADEGTGFRITGSALGVRAPIELLLAAGGEQKLLLTEDGAFRFPRRVADGTAFTVDAGGGCLPASSQGTVSGGDVSLAIVCPGVTELSLAFSYPFELVPRFDPAATEYPGCTRPYLEEDALGVTATADPSVTVDVNGSGVATASVALAWPDTRFDIEVSHPAGFQRRYQFDLAAVIREEAPITRVSIPGEHHFGGLLSNLVPSPALALSADTLVVGAPQQAGATGAAYVFRRSGGGWILEGELRAPAPTNNDFFGAAVAISGDRIVVGAPGAPMRTGQAFTFTRSATTWTHEQTLAPAISLAAGDRFGGAVAIDGDTAVVGAPNRTSGTGAAFLFRRSGSWGTGTALPGAVAGATFGGAVAMSLQRIVVGAYEEANQGAAYVFEGPSFASGLRLVAQAPSTGERFGWSVAIHADRIAVGAPFRSGQGAVSIFHRGTGTWATRDTVTSPHPRDGNEFGWSVAIYGDHLAVGSRSESSLSRGIDSTPTADSDLKVGAAHVFHYDGAAWLSDSHYLKASNALPNDNFGASIATYDDMLVVGAPGVNMRSGAVYAFR